MLSRRTLFSLIPAPLLGGLSRRPAPAAGQPTPYDVMTSRFRFPGGPTVTAIVRFWRPGDKARCKLCPACGSDPNRPGACMIVVNRPVEKADAALYRATGFESVTRRAEGGHR